MTKPERIPTNLRTLMILETIGKSDRPLTATQVNETIGLPKQTVHRLCKTLEKEGFLIREPNGKRLMPSARLKSLASGILFASQGQVATRQILQDVASRVNETINLAIPEENGMMYVDRVETGWSFRIQLPIGTNVPFHCTASGKAFLSSLSPTRRRAMLRSIKLVPKTINTHSDPERLLSELTKIAKQGYSVDNEEFMEGMVAVAVPVKDQEGRFCASLAFHAPTQRLSLEAALEFRTVLQDGAARLADVMFK